MIPPCYIALGSNLGDRAANIHAAIAAMHSSHHPALAGSRMTVQRVSSFVETAAVAWPGVEPGGPYLNAVAEVIVAPIVHPRCVLGCLLEIEQELGRDRTAGRWAPRTIDLDLLFRHDLVIDEPGLTLPHPRMGEREFVLAPLAELAPNCVVPAYGCTVAVMLAQLRAGKPVTPSYANTTPTALVADTPRPSRAGGEPATDRHTNT